ncbi:hypothetical protein Y032_0041g353 [Ancylostoma ceylanicum]|uniref:Uncharacterized protein n=1 Tax=Ancylostoma ceylanicum TaxID=53326 RepID=A0A016UGT6_9BILA|nr:hypothetical protein Y032_0041g353 [Ancylostoma ceylanicum]
MAHCHPWAPPEKVQKLRKVNFESNVNETIEFLERNSIEQHQDKALQTSHMCPFAEGQIPVRAMRPRRVLSVSAKNPPPSTLTSLAH